MNAGKPAIVTIGNFDGVHLGHQMLLRQVVERARALDLCSFAVTFEPHPEQVLFPERNLLHLSNSQERQQLLTAQGIDFIWVCNFTTDVARLEPEEFLRLVADRQPISELWIGADFALGRGRKGTIAVLSDLCGAAGWGLHMVPPYRLEGQVVSSSAIRTLLSTGSVRGAADLLGRPYTVPGTLDRSVFRVEPQRALPRPGAYEILIHGHELAGVVRASGREIDVAIPPGVTVPDGHARVEFLRRAD
jgi:riboflavin kinase / FMN adenylyltransferase